MTTVSGAAGDYDEKVVGARSVREKGAVRHLVDPDYHRNPSDPRGSLTVTAWGRNLCEFIEQHSGLKTQVVRLHDRRRGIHGEFLEVFISRKDR